LVSRFSPFVVLVVRFRPIGATKVVLGELVDIWDLDG